MRRFAIPLSIVATLAIAVTLFHLKQRVGNLEKQLSQVESAIVEHRETIQILRTEWSFLNRPKRIADLAEKFLGMRSTPSSRLIRLEDLPLRESGAGIAHTAGTAPTRPAPRAVAIHAGQSDRQIGSLR